MKAADPEKLLTSHEVAGLLQVNPTSVNKWAFDSLLHAYRTPGGHRRFKIGDVLAFAERHSMCVSDSRFAELFDGEVRVSLTAKGRAALEVPQ